MTDAMPPHGHLCWSYDDQEVFADQAEHHVAAGLAAMCADDRSVLLGLTRVRAEVVR
ncbi:hypothetical protein ACTMS0_01970 [Micromonospora sp. H33]|uniref:hypothetical protein n=1 Tax=Micromonospora sp. H33 TaxID=3452215 RepID=UPI003F89F847